MLVMRLLESRSNGTGRTGGPPTVELVIPSELIVKAFPFLSTIDCNCAACGHGVGGSGWIGIHVSRRVEQTSANARPQ